MVKIQAHLFENIISSNASEAKFLYKKNWFGEPVGEKIQYSIPETLFLVEENKMDVFVRNKKISEKELINRLKKIDKNIQIKYSVFRDLRKKGYIVKTALKFGAEFRVYEKGTNPGGQHAKWIVFVDCESRKLTWHEFAAKNRVAHSTRKNLLLAIVDEENDITYYEVRWIKP